MEAIKWQILIGLSQDQLERKREKNIWESVSTGWAKVMNKKLDRHDSVETLCRKWYCEYF